MEKLDLVDSINSDSLILAININNPDNQIWKWCDEKFNFTPLDCEEYGNCWIAAKDLSTVAKRAKSWVDGLGRPVTCYIIQLPK